VQAQRCALLDRGRGLDQMAEDPNCLNDGSALLPHGGSAVPEKQSFPSFSRLTSCCLGAVALSIVFLLGICALPKRSDVKSAMSLAVPSIRICRLGLDGQVGECRFGTAGSVACAGTTLLFCGSKSQCFQSDSGMPFCCGTGSVGCSDICVVPLSQRTILATNGRCNGIAPQGFRVPGTVFAIGASWDPQNKRYDFRSPASPMFINNPPFAFGVGDFTLTVTVTPGEDGRISRQGLFGTAILMSRVTRDLRGTPRNGFVLQMETRQGIGFSGTLVENVQVSLLLESGGPTDDAIRAITPGRLGANVPLTIRAIRQNVTLFLFLDGQLVSRREGRNFVDLGNDATAPFVIGASTRNFGTDNSSIDCYLSDISASDMAEFP